MMHGPINIRLTKAFGNHLIREADKTWSQFRNTVFEAVCGLRFTEYLSKTQI